MIHFRSFIPRNPSAAPFGVRRVALCLAFLFASGFANASSRTWTDRDGRTVEAELVRADADSVVIRRVTDGREFTLPRDRLSPADLAFLAAPPPASAQPTPVLSSPPPAAGDLATDPGVNAIFQYFAPSTDPKARPNSGAYLWLPPKSAVIRAVMVGIHNGLPLPLLQHPAVREVCRKHGIAQILLTPNGTEIGPVMLKDLVFDVTDPARTAIYDSYLSRLAELSGHPELASAPAVPLAHSAYASFPFDLAMRDPDRCLALLPVKAGLPDAYAFYGPGGKANTPNPALSLRDVPILFLQSASQETVGWSAYPRTGGPFRTYRQDRAGHPGDAYQPRNELFGAQWEMMSGHFDLLPRNYAFVAAWLDAIATARLPERPGQPLNRLTLRDGWLLNPAVPAAGALPPAFPSPAPYLEFTGDRSTALWYPNRDLAERQFALYRDEPRREIELFTFLDASGQPLSLAHGHMAEVPKNSLPLDESGAFTLVTHHLTTPPDICTVKERGHEKKPDPACVLANIGFPGRDSLPVSTLPLDLDLNAAPVELVRREESRDTRSVRQTRFTLRIIRTRFAPEVGYLQFYPRIYHEGDTRFAATGRTAKLEWSLPDLAKDGAPQTVDFPQPADAPASSASIPLAATSSAGLPVSYFVVHGPGFIRDGGFIPADLPAGLRAPIAVTVGAYQNGRYGSSPVRPSSAVYRTFRLLP